MVATRLAHSHAPPPSTTPNALPHMEGLRSLPAALGFFPVFEIRKQEQLRKNDGARVFPGASVNDREFAFERMLSPLSLKEAARRIFRDVIELTIRPAAGDQPSHTRRHRCGRGDP